MSAMVILWSIINPTKLKYIRNQIRNNEMLDMAQLLLIWHNPDYYHKDGPELWTGLFCVNSQI